MPPSAAGKASSNVGSVTTTSHASSKAGTVGDVAPVWLYNGDGEVLATAPDGCTSTVVPLDARSSEPSSPLFSWGFTVERMTITLLSRSNQKGAPIEVASAMISHPSKGPKNPFQAIGGVSPE